MVYSCGYFRTTEDDLDTAQYNKLELICRKLRLRREDRFLDIGCGWGSLAMHAAEHHGVFATGVTVSEGQAATAQNRIEESRLTQSCKIECLDYREVRERFGTFDRIASVGMIEHVGLDHLPEYFHTAYALLKPGGAFLNHGIVRATSARFCGPRLADAIDSPLLKRVPLLRNLRDPSFIDKYVFPDGELPTISEVVRAAEDAGFEIRDLENLREHYERTLRLWVEGLKRNAAALLTQVSEVTYRTWLLYMAGCAAAFQRGDIAVHQILLSRPESGRGGLPLTREDWYTPGFGVEIR
jgi:cyclopropane-fatty-acyl-phospholipid synthase